MKSVILSILAILFGNTACYGHDRTDNHASLPHDSDYRLCTGYKHCRQYKRFHLQDSRMEGGTQIEMIFIEIQTESGGNILLNLEEISMIGPDLGDMKISIALKNGTIFKALGTYDRLRDQISDAVR